MYTLTQILKDLAKESVPPPEMIRTIWDRILLSLSQKKLEEKSQENSWKDSIRLRKREENQ